MPIVGQFGSLAGLGSLILPGGVMESIQTVTLSNSTTSSVTFSDVGGYQHLQIRGLIRNTRAASVDGSTMTMRFNSDTGSNYFSHRLRGDGVASANAYTTRSSLYMVDYASDSATASVFTAFVIDILDYGSTSKNKTVRSLQGADFNGSGYVNIMSGAWNSTSAVTSITLLDATYNFKQYSTFALFGIRS